MKQARFFLTLITGLIVGTFLHEVYHYLEAYYHNANPQIVIRGFGVGVQSSYYSSETVAFTITGVCFIISLIIAIHYENK